MRVKYSELIELIDNFPALAIIGPRQVGKTTLARLVADDRPCSRRTAKLCEPCP